MDSAVFLMMIGFFSWGALLTMTASKMIAAGSVWFVSDKGKCE